MSGNAVTRYSAAPSPFAILAACRTAASAFGDPSVPTTTVCMPQSTHIADRVSRAKIVRADDDGGHAGGHAHRTRASATLTLPQQPRQGAPDAAGYGDRPALLARGRPVRPAHGRGAQREADRPPARVTPVTA